MSKCRCHNRIEANGRQLIYLHNPLHLSYNQRGSHHYLRVPYHQFVPILKRILVCNINKGLKKLAFYSGTAHTLGKGSMSVSACPESPAWSFWFRNLYGCLVTMVVHQNMLYTPPVISKEPPELLCRGIDLWFGLFVAIFGCGIKLHIVPRVGKVDVYRVSRIEYHWMHKMLLFLLCHKLRAKVILMRWSTSGYPQALQCVWCMWLHIEHGPFQHTLHQGCDFRWSWNFQ